MFFVLSKSTAITITGTGLGYVLTIVLARAGAGETYGTYAYFLSWAAILVTVISYVSDQVFAKFFSVSASLQHALNVVFSIKSVLLGLVLLGILVVHYAISPEVSLRVLLLIVPAFNLGIVFEVLNRNVMYASIVLLEKLALLLVNFILLDIYDFEKVVYLSFFFVSLSSLVVQYIYFRKYVLRLSLASICDIIAYLRQYSSVFFIVLTQLAYGHFSRILIEHKKGVETFAYLSLAFQIISVAAIFQSQVDRVFRRRLITSFSRPDFVEIRSVLLSYFTLTTFPLVCFAIALYCNAERIALALFGVEYEGVGYVLKLLSPLILSINLMRLGDIIWISINKTIPNFLITSLFTLSLLLSLSLLPAELGLSSFLEFIVAFQFCQIATSFLCIHKFVKGTLDGQLV